ncbi:hypothetical protein Bbelb_045300, partial [Branchiostoma belcheri]
MAWPGQYLGVAAWSFTAPHRSESLHHPAHLTSSTGNFIAYRRSPSTVPAMPKRARSASGSRKPAAKKAKPAAKRKAPAAAAAAAPPAKKA